MNDQNSRWDGIKPQNLPPGVDIYEDFCYDI